MIRSNDDRISKIAWNMWRVVQILPEQTFQDCKEWLDEIEKLLIEEANESIPIEWIYEWLKQHNHLSEYIMIDDWRKENEADR